MGDCADLGVVTIRGGDGVGLLYRSYQSEHCTEISINAEFNTQFNPKVKVTLEFPSYSSDANSFH